MKKLLFVLLAASAVMAVSCGRNAQKASAKSETIHVTVTSETPCTVSATCAEGQKAECAAACENCPKAQGQPCDGTCGCENPEACAQAKAACEGNAGCDGQKCSAETVECK